MIFNLMYADVKPFFASGSQTIIHPLIGASFRAEKRQGSEGVIKLTDIYNERNYKCAAGTRACSATTAGSRALHYASLRAPWSS
eukprot:1263934-Pyramimonas_sp.AAC.1